MLVGAERASSVGRCIDQCYRSTSHARYALGFYKLTLAGLAVIGLAGAASADVTLGVLVPASGKGDVLIGLISPAMPAAGSAGT